MVEVALTFFQTHTYTDRHTTVFIEQALPVKTLCFLRVLGIQFPSTANILLRPCVPSPDASEPALSTSTGSNDSSSFSVFILIHFVFKFFFSILKLICVHNLIHLLHDLHVNNLSLANTWSIYTPVHLYC